MQTGLKRSLSRWREKAVRRKKKKKKDGKENGEKKEKESCNELRKRGKGKLMG